MEILHLSDETTKGNMAVLNEDEDALAFEEYRKRGVIEHDWKSWADLFTEGAQYVEHYLGSFIGREQISQWITSTMKEYPNISLWMSVDLNAEAKMPGCTSSSSSLLSSSRSA